MPVLRFHAGNSVISRGVPRHRGGGPGIPIYGSGRALCNGCLSPSPPRCPAPVCVARVAVGSGFCVTSR
eukprot:8391442-Lingulodinium_polyedra.AAC.1